MNKLPLILLLTSFNGFAQENINPVLGNYLKALTIEASSENPTFSAFSATDGKTLFFKKFNHKKKPVLRSCSTCHSKNPTTEGKTRAGKTIKPMMPIEQHERFTKTKKINKWFNKNAAPIELHA